MHKLQIARGWLLAGISAILFTGCAVNVDEKMVVSPSTAVDQANLLMLMNQSGYQQSTIEGPEGKKLFYLEKRVPAPALTLLVFHGNALNLSKQPWFGQMQVLAELPVNVLAIDYRGFGLSEGEASLTNMVADARAAYDHIEADTNIIVFGLSLGSVMATSLLDEPRVKGIILEGAVTSVEDMVALYKERSLFRSFANLSVGNNIRFDNGKYLQQSKKPVLVIHGEKDESIPWQMGRELYEQAGTTDKMFFKVKNGGHCDSFRVAKAAYMDTLKRFLHDLEKQAVAGASTQ